MSSPMTGKEVLSKSIVEFAEGREHKRNKNEATKVAEWLTRSPKKMVKQKVTMLQGTKKDGISYYQAPLSDDEDEDVGAGMNDESMEEGNEDEQHKQNVQEENGKKQCCS
jgi:hypothetical protein